MRRHFMLLTGLLAVSALAGGPVSDTLTVTRPKGGEYFGVYLSNQKVGWMLTRVQTNADGNVESLNEMHFRAKVGTRISDRVMRELKVFEPKPNGKLLSFKLEQLGDGGDQTLEGVVKDKALVVTRTRPGLKPEIMSLPLPKEVVEDADQARVALKRNASLAGQITDTTDLKQYTVTTTVAPAETRTIRGVKVTLKKAITISEKEKVPTEAFVDEQGRMVEVRFGPTTKAMMEPEDQAKRFDLVDVFGLTRVKLPKPPPPEVRDIPGSMTMVMSGLPEHFQVETYRQSFSKLDGQKVTVKLAAAAPKKKAVRPLADPNGGKNLESDIIVEAAAADIVKQAKAIVGTEKDAYTAAKKISRWVNVSVAKDYGASSDRATDVLRTLKGDCTEHSLLAVALLRAAGIPARRVDGVVYLMNEDQVPALYWHEWVEAFVGEWTQLDPTFGQDIADATHFKVGEEGNAEITPLIGSLVVHDVR